MSGDNGGSSEMTPGSPPRPQPQLPRISSPYSRILANQYPGSQQMGSQNLRPSNLEMSPLARTLSQPVPFPLDSAGTEQRCESSYSLLQPSYLAPSGSCYGIGAGFQAHRRASTIEAVPFQPSGSNIPWKNPGGLDMLAQLVNSDPVGARDDNAEMMGKSKMVQVEEDVFSAFMDLDCMDSSTPSGTAGNSGNDVEGAFDFQGVDGGETDENSSADERWRVAFKRPVGVSSMPEMGEGIVSAAVEDVSQMNLHVRSISEDSFMQNTDLADDFFELPPYPGTHPAGQILSSMISTASESNPNGAGLTLGGVAFTGEDVNKILDNQRLSEIALRDPRRAKRILSNRRSAARSKERKLKYVAELEQRIATLQNERTMLAAQLAQLERDAAVLTNQNNELKLRLQALEQQAHLQEALKAAMAEELRRLRLEKEASSSRIHQYERLLLSRNNETGETQPPENQTEPQDDEATPSAQHEPKA